jgi:hypothetical protein
MLIGITDEAVLMTGMIQTDGLKFVVSHVVYGSGGFNPLSPTEILPLDPAATSLSSELFRKPVPQENTVINEIYNPRGKETTYTTVSGLEFTGYVGEAGLIATITDPGSSGTAVGDQFLLAQAHFGRIVFGSRDRLAIAFPIAYFAGAVTSTTYDEESITYSDEETTYSG